MANSLEIFQIDAFTDIPLKGNPAAVVYSNDLSDYQMQDIANEMNLSETAFLSDSDKADFKLRWFTPKREVDLCGHATIASLHFIKEIGLRSSGDTISLETRSGMINCKISERKYFMEVPTPELSEFDGCREEIIDALGLDRWSIDDNIPFIILNNGYVYIYVRSLSLLNAVEPDFNKLLKISFNNNQITDFALFTDETNESTSSAHLRFFAPFFGINEDPVTGSALAPLLLVMKHLELIKDIRDKEFIFEQGDNLKRKGRAFVSFTNNKLLLSGNAITILKGRLFL